MVRYQTNRILCGTRDAQLMEPTHFCACGAELYNIDVDMCESCAEKEALSNKIEAAVEFVEDNPKLVRLMVEWMHAGDEWERFAAEHKAYFREGLS